MIEIRDLKIGDIIEMTMANSHYVAGEVTALNIEEKAGTPMSDERPGRVPLSGPSLWCTGLLPVHTWR